MALTEDTDRTDLVHLFRRKHEIGLTVKTKEERKKKRTKENTMI